MSIGIEWVVSGYTVEGIDHGASGAGTTLSGVEISLRHDGNNPITNCKLYAGTKSGSYSGDFTASGDFNELLSWGDSNEVSGFGGLQVNFDAQNLFPTNNWPTVSGKNDFTYNTFRTSAGDSSANGIILPTQMSSTPSMPIEGTIPVACSVWPTMKLRIQIPNNESSTGKRQFDLKLKYSYTS